MYIYCWSCYILYIRLSEDEEEEEEHDRGCARLFVCLVLFYHSHCFPLLLFLVVFASEKQP